MQLRFVDVLLEISDVICGGFPFCAQVRCGDGDEKRCWLDSGGNFAIGGSEAGLRMVLPMQRFIVVMWMMGRLSFAGGFVRLRM